MEDEQPTFMSIGARIKEEYQEEEVKAKYDGFSDTDSEGAWRGAF